MVRNIIWDWNGTILDDTAICFRVANRMLRERGLCEIPDFETYRRMFRFPVIDYYYETGYTFETETYESVAEEFGILYGELLPSCGLKDGIREVTDILRTSGYRQYLLSTASQETLEAQLRKFFPEHPFEDIAGQTNDLAFGKEERGRVFVRNKGFQPGETVFVGDTDHDYCVATASGCRCILLDSGNQTREVLLRCGVPVIHSLRELPEMIERLDAEV